MNETKHSTPADAHSRRNILLIIFLITVISLLAIPSTAFAALDNDGGVTSTADWCAVNNTDNAARNDYSTCLPAGRWGNLVGTLSLRNEPADISINGLGNLFGNALRTTKSAIPGMFMQVTQICWSSALALSQFAATFDPLDIAGAKVDAAVATLINGNGDGNGLMQGSIPAALVVLAILGFIGAAAFDVGTVKEASKRLGATVICLAMMIALGAGAAKTGVNASAPATGSPWWVMRTINSTINKLTVNLNLDGLTGSSSMMAYDNPKESTANCQDYLQAMHNQYDTNPNHESSTSNVTKTINRLWEETALRSYVTMQYGNPQAGGNVSQKVADNAKMAYCHVLDMKAGTDTSVQQFLTNAEMGLGGENTIDSKTARWIFDESGWISTLHSMVDDGDSTDDRDDGIMQDRAAIFWETCAASNGDIKARDGWSQLIQNLGDNPTYEIKNGGRKIRVGNNETSNLGDIGRSLKRVRPSDGDKTLMSTNTTTLCRSVLGNKTNVFHRADYGPKPDSGSEPKKSNDAFIDTDLGDAATLGWRFDVPNIGATWSEANLGNLSDTNTSLGAMKSTIDHMYGNADADWLGAFGSIVGGFCAFIVFGLLSVVLIVAKLMFSLMGLFLIFAFLIRAVPVGEKPKKIMVNWIKYSANLGMTGMLYSVIATLATFICSITLSFCSGMASSFTYNVIAGGSPVLSLIMISLFCSKIVKCGNPFSLHAMMDIAGGGALVSGVTRGMNMLNTARRNRFYKNAMRNHGRHSDTPRYSSTASGSIPANTTNGMATESQQVLEHAASTFSATPKDSHGGTSSGYESRLGRWMASHGAGTVSGEMADVGEYASRQGSKTVKAAKGILHPTDRTQEFARKYVASHPTASAQEAMDYAHRKQMWHSVRSRAANIGRMAFHGVGGVLAGGLVRTAIAGTRSQAVRRVAKTAATAGVAVAAFTNPLTAPLGLAALGKIATDRDTYQVAAGIGRTGMKLAGKSQGLIRKAAPTVGGFLGSMPQRVNERLTDALDNVRGAGYIDPEAMQAVDNPFQSMKLEADPETESKLISHDEHGVPHSTQLGADIQESLLRDKRHELLDAGLSPEETERQLMDYASNGELATDLFKAGQTLTNVEHGYLDENMAEPTVNPLTGEVNHDLTYDRMRAADGSYTPDAAQVMDEARSIWSENYQSEHPEMSMDDVLSYADQHPEEYEGLGRQIFNDRYGFKGESSAAGQVDVPDDQLHPDDYSAYVTGSKPQTPPAANDGQTMPMPPVQAGSGEPTQRMEPVTAPASHTGQPLPVADNPATPAPDVYQRTVVDHDGNPQAVQTNPLWNHDGTAMTEQGQSSYDAVERQYRQHYHDLGLSSEQITQNLDKPEVQRKLQEQARRYYDRHYGRSPQQPPAGGTNPTPPASQPPIQQPAAEQPSQPPVQRPTQPSTRPSAQQPIQRPPAQRQKGD